MSPQSFQLVMRSGPTPGKTFPLNKAEMTIGRDTSNEIAINDAEVSRKHSRLVMKGAGYTLEDLGSTNGTFVNGQRLMGPHNLRPGELILLGENVSLNYEAALPDVDATVIGAAGPTAMPAAQQVPPFYGQPEPAFSGQVPPGPEEMIPAAPPVQKRGGGRRTWLLAGCGCLLLIVCCLLVAFLIIDQPWSPGAGLYCEEPFRAIFQVFGFCP
jgi:hypothetical protein